MSIKDAGGKYPIERDCKILEVNSPSATRSKSEVGIFGNPHVVVAKCIKQRWAIVALTRRQGDFKHNERRLGIRWFHSVNGHPTSRNYAVWFILPQEFHSCILQKLKLSKAKRELVTEFLKGEVVNPLTDGETLKKDWKAA